MKYKEQDLLDSLKEETILEQLSALSGWDALTGMPQDSGHFRSEVDAYLAEKQFLVATQTKRRDMLAYFDDRLNELSDLGREIFPKVKKRMNVSRYYRKKIMLILIKQCLWHKIIGHRHVKKINMPSLSRISSN